jgi:hypothetical protein
MGQVLHSPQKFKNPIIAIFKRSIKDDIYLDGQSKKLKEETRNIKDCEVLADAESAVYRTIPRKFTMASDLTVRTTT